MELDVDCVVAGKTSSPLDHQVRQDPRRSRTWIGAMSTRVESYAHDAVALVARSIEAPVHR